MTLEAGHNPNPPRLPPYCSLTLVRAAELSYDPLLINFFEGLTEKQHPHVFVVRAGIPQLLMAQAPTPPTVAAPEQYEYGGRCDDTVGVGSQDGPEKAAPLVSRLIPLVRAHLCACCTARHSPCVGRQVRQALRSRRLSDPDLTPI